MRLTVRNFLPLFLSLLLLSASAPVGPVLPGEPPNVSLVQLQFAVTPAMEPAMGGVSCHLGPIEAPLIMS